MLKRNFLIGLAITIISSSVYSLPYSVEHIFDCKLFNLILVQAHENENSLFDNKVFGTNSENLKIKSERILLSTENTVSSDTSNNNSTFNPSDQVSIPESSKKWTSKVSYEERQQYESMLLLKKSFQGSLNFLPISFHPESSEYVAKVGIILEGFIAISLFVLTLIILYLIMRFGCKKFIGPIKSSQVTRSYRNLTWILMSKYE